MRNFSRCNRSWYVSLFLFSRDTAYGYPLHSWGRVYVPQSHWQDLRGETEQQPSWQESQLFEAQAAQTGPASGPFLHRPLCWQRTKFSFTSYLTFLSYFTQKLPNFYERIILFSSITISIFKKKLIFFKKIAKKYIRRKIVS